MKDCMKSCKRTAKSQEMESSSSSFSSSKRSKISLFSELEIFPPHFLLQNRRFFPNNSPPNSVSSSAGDLCSGDSLASRCSSNESLEIVKDCFRLVDLEARNETDISTCINGNKFSRENTPSSELRADPEEMDSPAKNSSDPRKPPSSWAKAPPREEIEEFLSAAEKHEQKRFAKKYNYDTVKDAPLEGNYQWVRLKP